MNNRPRCIYCGEEGQSAEHLYGQWLRDILPDFGNKHVITTTGWRDGLRQEPIDESRFKAGSLYNASVRAPCRSCNSGWMNVINGEAREALTRLKEGEWWPTTPSEREALATWLTMFTINHTYALPLASPIPADEPKKFMTARRPMPRWSFWVGLLHPECRWQVGTKHTKTMFFGNTDLAAGPNSLTLCIPLKRALFMCFRTSTGFSISAEAAKKHLFLSSIWPMKAWNMFPSPPLIDDVRAENIAHWMERPKIWAALVNKPSSAIEYGQ